MASRPILNQILNLAISTFTTGAKAKASLPSTAIPVTVSSPDTMPNRLRPRAPPCRRDKTRKTIRPIRPHNNAAPPATINGAALEREFDKLTVGIRQALQLGFRQKQRR